MASNTLGNQNPQPSSGNARSDTSDVAGSNNLRRNDSVSTTPWQLVKPGTAETMTVGGVDYPYTTNDTYIEIA